MRTQTLSKLKNELKLRQQELQREHNEFLDEQLNNMQNSVGELSTYDNHPADLGTELYEREKDTALNDRTTRELENIEKALARIEEGTYGTCSICGRTIPLERLEALPWTDRCINHVQDENITKTNDDTIPSMNLHNHLNTNEEVIYDQEDTWQEVAKYGTSETPSDFTEDHDDYNHMYINSDEPIGEVESVEQTALANLFGYETGSTEFMDKQ